MMTPIVPLALKLVWTMLGTKKVRKNRDDKIQKILLIDKVLVIMKNALK